MKINWYPGQMARAKRLLRQNLKFVDAVIEVLDARIPASSRNHELRALAASRPMVAVLTRPDLADAVATSYWLKKLRTEYLAAVAVNGVTGEGMKSLLQQLRQIPKKRETRPLRIIVAGIPNVGKSSLINRLAGRSPAMVGDKPGITRNQQWIRVHEGLEVLDTPGMLWPKITSHGQAFALAAVGSVRDETVDPVELGGELLQVLWRRAPSALQDRYGLEMMSENAHEMLRQVGRRRGCLLRGGEVDLAGAARLLIKDFREGRLGRITLEESGETVDEGG